MVRFKKTKLNRIVHRETDRETKLPISITKITKYLIGAVVTAYIALSVPRVHDYFFLDPEKLSIYLVDLSSGMNIALTTTPQTPWEIVQDYMMLLPNDEQENLYSGLRVFANKGLSCTEQLSESSEMLVPFMENNLENISTSVLAQHPTKVFDSNIRRALTLVKRDIEKTDKAKDYKAKIIMFTSGMDYCGVGKTNIFLDNKFLDISDKNTSILAQVVVLHDEDNGYCEKLESKFAGVRCVVAKSSSEIKGKLSNLSDSYQNPLVELDLKPDAIQNSKQSNTRNEPPNAQLDKLDEFARTLEESDVVVSEDFSKVSVKHNVVNHYFKEGNLTGMVIWAESNLMSDGLVIPQHNSTFFNKIGWESGLIIESLNGTKLSNSMQLGSTLMGNLEHTQAVISICDKFKKNCWTQTFIDDRR